MNRLIPGILVASLIGLSGLPEGFAGESSYALDGMRFVGMNGVKGWTLASDEAETIVFEGGLFTSLSCEPYNFSSSQYSTTVEGERIHFDAITTSPTHGKIVWKGVVDGDIAEGTFVWTKERWYWDTRREYWFKGTLQQ